MSKLSFQFLKVLGNGSKWTANHHQWPMAAYQSGSVLMLWNYHKNRQQEIHLEPNVKFVALFFSKDASTIMGFWISPQNCQPHLSVWRVRDRTPIAVHPLSDSILGPKILVDYNAEVSCYVIVHVGQVGFASVSFWDAYSLRPQRIAESDGHIGNTQDLVCVRMMGDGRHFITLSPYKMKIWTFGQQVPRMEREVEAKQPLRTCEVSGGMIYVVTEKGRVLVLTLTDDKAVDSISDPGVKFQAMAIGSAYIFLGADNGAVHVYPKDRKSPVPLIKIPPPEPESMSPVLASWAVTHISAGANDDYAIVCFADGTYGVVHMSSQQYVALHMGHSSSVRAVAMAPRLEIRPGRLESRLQDPNGYVESQAFTFLTVAKDTNWITWRSGPPFRDSIFRQIAPPAILGPDPNLYQDLEAFAPLAAPHYLPGEMPLELTAVCFKPKAFLSNDGRLPGAYELLVGTQDSGLYLLVLEESEPVPATGQPSAKLQWCVKKVRPESPELSERGPEPMPLANSMPPNIDAFHLPNPLTLPDWAPGDSIGWYRVNPDTGYVGLPQKDQPKAVCCDLTFSRCLKMVVASYTNGFSELLQYPELNREMIVQHAFMAPVAPESCCAKAFFVWKPVEEDRVYDQNHYLLSHSNDPQEVVLFEVYKIGVNRAKTCRHTYRLPVHPHYGARDAHGAPAPHSAAAITDFKVHPSQCYIIVAASLASDDHSARAYVFNLWDSPEVRDVPPLSVTTLFTSHLIASRGLRPTLCLDSVGAFVFVTSSPAMIGAPEQINGSRDALGVAALIDAGGRAAGGLPQDNLVGPKGAMTVPKSKAPSEGVSLTSSVMCIIDFSTGIVVSQSSFEVSYMCMGSLAHDITWLLMGAHDGTLSVWRPPEPVSEVIRQTLEASKREYTTHKARSGNVIDWQAIEVQEEAIAWHWHSNLCGRINWSKWAFDAQASPSTAQVQQGPGELQMPPVLPRPPFLGGGLGNDAGGMPPSGPSQMTPPPWMLDEVPAADNDVGDVVVQARLGLGQKQGGNVPVSSPFIGGRPLSMLAAPGPAKSTAPSDALPPQGNAMWPPPYPPFGFSPPRSRPFDDHVMEQMHPRWSGGPLREPASEWPGPQNAFTNDREAARWNGSHRGTSPFGAQQGFGKAMMRRQDEDRNAVFITQHPSDSGSFLGNVQGPQQLHIQPSQALWNDMARLPDLVNDVPGQVGGPPQDDEFELVASMFDDIDRFEQRRRDHKQAAPAP